MSLDNSAAATVIDTVLCGKVVDFTRPGSRSAIAKTPVRDEVVVGRLGLSGDEQGDLRVHGGPDKAVHHYPHDHYTDWRADLGEHPLLASPGAFGENLSSSGLTEHDVCLGDQFRLGTALVEISQSRQPCWKLSDRFQVSDMARRVQDSGRTGWYYRVLEEGRLQTGDRLELVDRPHPQWPLSRIIEVLYQRTLEPALLAQILDLPLVPSWRGLFERRKAHGQTESWNKRLTGVADSH